MFLLGFPLPFEDAHSEIPAACTLHNTHTHRKAANVKQRCEKDAL